MFFFVLQVSQKQHLFLTVAAFIDHSCVEIERECAAVGAEEISERRWWDALFHKFIGWMHCLDNAKKIAVFSDVRSQVFHLAALIDEQALQVMVEDEMLHRLRLSVATLMDRVAPAPACAPAPAPVEILERYCNGILRAVRTAVLL